MRFTEINSVAEKAIALYPIPCSAEPKMCKIYGAKHRPRLPNLQMFWWTKCFLHSVLMSNEKSTSGLEVILSQNCFFFLL